METLRKTASVLIFPVLAWVGAACDKTLPTEPQPLGAPTTGSNWGGVSGTTRWVNDDGTVFLPPGNGCGNPGYQHIQSAVNDANPGDRINVCPGTYPEQVKVASGKDNITLKSVGLWKAVITAPPVLMSDVDDAPTNELVRVTAAHNVTIVGFTISGPAPAGQALYYGVRVDNSASAYILGNHIIHIRDDPFNGSQHGVAVIVGRPTAASAQILGNVFEDYQKNGPTVDKAGSSAEISYNRVIGHGATDMISQNGIQVSRGATGTVRHNFVSQNIYTLGGGATGVFFYMAGQVASEHNTVTANDYGVYSQGTASGSTVTESHVRASNLDGVVLDGSNYNQVTHNASDHNSWTGVSLIDDASNNSVVQNQIQNNALSGILLDMGNSGTGNNNKNILSANHVKSNGSNSQGPDMTDGIRINTGSGNTITGNHLKNNITHDCHDNTGVDNTVPVQNTWSDNGVGTSFPMGLCGYDDDDGEDVNTFGWDASYPWYLSFSDAADLDFVTGYSQFDLTSLLQLLPSVSVSGVTRPKPSPAQ